MKRLRYPVSLADRLSHLHKEMMCATAFVAILVGDQSSITAVGLMIEMSVAILPAVLLFLATMPGLCDAEGAGGQQAGWNRLLAAERNASFSAGRPHTQRSAFRTAAFSLRWRSDACKRALDIAASVALLVLSAPLLVLTAIAIKLDSPGPVFYTQTRIGHGGKPFRIIKFRSMVEDAEPDGCARWAQDSDPRVTRLGAALRKARIDEIPQAINVLSGDMSFVGPRPERPEFVDELAKQIPNYSKREHAKPGITGWAQVNCAYAASVEDAREKLRYDLHYVDNWSLLFDLVIMLRTVRVILFAEGAR